MKPDWDHAPQWARFLAMDRDGDWFWYENEPKLSRFYTEWEATHGRLLFAGKIKPWHESLEANP